MHAKVRCAACRFVRVDRKASEGKWLAYECGNHESEYYRCLLNITEDGDMLGRIAWSGCKLGELRPDARVSVPGGAL